MPRRVSALKKEKGKGKRERKARRVFLSQEESSFRKTEKQVSQQHFQNAFQTRKIKPSFEIFENIFVLSDGIVILLKLLLFFKVKLDLPKPA